MEPDKKFKLELSKQIMFNVMGTADYFIGEGTHKFDEFAVTMVHEFGHWIKPYLKLIYTGFHNFPINNGHIIENMDSVEYVQSFNLMSLFTVESFHDDYFKLEAVDYQAIQLTRTVVQKLLERCELKSKEIVGIGNFLFALDRLPKKTFGVNVDITIEYEIKSATIPEKRQNSLCITDDEFCIQTIRFENENSDETSASVHVWHLESNGEREINVEFEALENEMNEPVTQSIELWVGDTSEIDFNEIDFVEYFTLNEK